MAVLLITYDLNNETKRPPLLQTLKDLFPAWARLSESSYAVSTDLPPEQVYNALAPLLDADDNCFVITLNRPWWGRAQQDDVMEWLKGAL
ncbi:hypothetical protein [Acidovorax sp. A1169]|uniref:hypothetical protein n=1 Tax=Acidovorax sp. A1169 TaxID=3059524 RepID=UPI002737C737|nr:hypothetical protein [Acidovorax sp. A1169]MDP4076215.1 hypothetical protein [Acidovorax sp. A1169]